LVRTIRGFDQPIDGLADQGFQFRIVIGPAIGGQNPLMLFFGSRALQDAAVGFGSTGRCGGRGLEPADIAAGGKGERRAQHHGRSPKPAAHSSLAPSRTIHHDNYSCVPGELIPAQKLDLLHPEHVYSRTATRLNETPNTNPPIFEGLRHHTGRLENR